MALPRQTARREIIRKFRALGWEGPISGTKHQFMKKGTLKVRIPNPHGKDEVGQSLLKEILAQAGVSEDEWLNA